MKPPLRIFLMLFTLLFLFSTLSASAGTTRLLAPQNDTPTAWLSAKAGSKTGLHDLRVILVIPKNQSARSTTVSVSFEGDNAPASVSKLLSELPLYRTLKAGESVYTTAEGDEMRVLTLTDLADTSYTSLSLTLTQGDRTVYTATNFPG